MKFLMFADLHYGPRVFYPATVDTVRFFQKRAVEEGCDFILHAGDLCHGPSRVPELMAVCDSSPVPFYHCLGNHDTDGTPLEDTLKYYHMPDGHYCFDCKGYRFIILDPNYCYVNGKYIHYDMGNYFQWPGNRDHTPPEQLQWLETTVDESPYPCILVSHDSYEREKGGARQFREVQEIIARQLNIPVSKVYGVVTFYSFFTMTPKGEHPISVCMGTACYVRGAEKVLDEFKRILKIEVGETTPDGKFSLSSLRCVGACGLAPVVLIGEKVYGRVTPAEVEKILKEFN